MSDYIYKKNDRAEKAYMLKNGKVILELTEDDELEWGGENSVFGFAELMLSKEDKIDYGRLFSIRKLSNTGDVTSVSDESLEKSFSHPNIAFRLAKNLAEQVKLLNGLVIKKNSELGEEEKLIQGYSKLIAWSVNQLEEEYKQKRFPWLEDIIKEYKSSLTYVKGQSFLAIDAKPSVEIKGDETSELNRHYPAGSVVCEQGSSGDEMFILVSGKLRVLINNDPIDDIDEQGTSFGEMALLLGEKRSATIKAVEDTVLTVIKKSNLKNVMTTEPDFLYFLCLTLSRWLLNTSTKINHIYDLIKEKEDTDEKKSQVFSADDCRTELKELRQKVLNFYNRHNMEWLYEIASKIADEMMALRGK